MINLDTLNKQQKEAVLASDKYIRIIAGAGSGKTRVLTTRIAYLILEKEVYQNKINKGFNVTDLNMEFCCAYGELGEAYSAWLKKKDDLGEELADVVIFLMGISEILGLDLGEEIKNKIEKNKTRVYKNIDGVPYRIKG